MANLKSFDEGGLRSKITESTGFIQQFVGQDSFETDTELEQFVSAMDTSVSAMLELSQRGHTTPEQDAALYTFLRNNGVIE